MTLNEFTALRSEERALQASWRLLLAQAHMSARHLVEDRLEAVHSEIAAYLAPLASQHGPGAPDLSREAIEGEAPALPPANEIDLRPWRSRTAWRPDWSDLGKSLFERTDERSQ